MHYYVITAFPKIFDGPLSETILKRAIEKELISIDIVGLRDFAGGKHLQLDDYAFGGGPGMVMMPEPIVKAFESLPVKRGDKGVKFLFTSPQGAPLNQAKLEELSEFDTLVILSGRYKGVDQRIIDNYIDEEISIGDYVLSGGEIPSLVLIDGISRLIPGVLGNAKSKNSDTFHSLLLDYPTYTRPADWNGLAVPEVLLSGNHQKIAEWRLEQSIKKTAERRKDLYEKYLEKLKERENE